MNVKKQKAQVKSIQQITLLKKQHFEATTPPCVDCSRGPIHHPHAPDTVNRLNTVCSQSTS